MTRKILIKKVWNPFPELRPAEYGVFSFTKNVGRTKLATIEKRGSDWWIVDADGTCLEHHVRVHMVKKIARTLYV